MSLSLQKKNTLVQGDVLGQNASRCLKFTKKSTLFSVALVFFISLQICSCMTMADYDYTSIDQSISRGEYKNALSVIEHNANHIYSDRDKVLYLLDKGMLLQYANDSTASNEVLAKAEKLIYDYYAKSVTQNISSYIANDTVVDYAGDTYEDVYTNVFMALNYLQLGDTENAMVEIRRFDNKLKEVTQKYQTTLSRVQQQVTDGTKLDTTSIEFHNSALARYLSMLLYRASDDYASAAVDSRLLQSAFVTEPDLYNFSVPSSIAEELAVQKQDARLNLIAFTGKAPIKRENNIRIASPDGFYYKIALPEMIKRGSAISQIVMTARNETTGVTTQAVTQKIESIENIALDTYRQNQSVIYGRAVVRSLVKSSTTSVFGVLEDNANNRDDRQLYHSLKLIAAMATEYSERADVRTSRFFPASADVAGLTLEPGAYTVTVEYYTSHGKKVEAKKYEHVMVAAGKINLIESVCLQ